MHLCPETSIALFCYLFRFLSLVELKYCRACFGPSVVVRPHQCPANGLWVMCAPGYSSLGPQGSQSLGQSPVVTNSFLCSLSTLCMCHVGVVPCKMLAEKRQKQKHVYE